MRANRWVGVVSLALAVLVPSAARAGFYSGDELYKICTTPRTDRDYVERSYECIAYVTGAVDAFNAAQAADKPSICVPPDVTIRQLREVTMDYLRVHPGEGSAAQSVFAAMRQQWPCSTAASKPAKAVKQRKRRL